MEDGCWLFSHRSDRALIERCNADTVQGPQRSHGRQAPDAWGASLFDPRRVLRVLDEGKATHRT